MKTNGMPVNGDIRAVNYLNQDGGGSDAVDSLGYYQGDSTDSNPIGSSTAVDDLGFYQGQDTWYDYGQGSSSGDASLNYNSSAAADDLGYYSGSPQDGSSSGGGMITNSANFLKNQIMSGSGKAPSSPSASSGKGMITESANFLKSLILSANNAKQNPAAKNNQSTISNPATNPQGNATNNVPAPNSPKKMSPYVVAGIVGGSIFFIAAAIIVVKIVKSKK